MKEQKEKILTEVRQALFNDGLVNKDLDSVLERARVSKGNFNSFFKTKKDILSAILEFESDKLYAKLSELCDNSTNPLATLNSFTDWKLSNYSSNGSIIARLGSEFVEKDIQLKKKIRKIYGEYTSYIVRLLEEGVIKGQLLPSTPVKQLANFIVYSLEGGSISVNLTDSVEQFEHVINMVKRIIRSYRNLDLTANI